MEEQDNQCIFILLPREIQLIVVSVIEDVDDLLALVQVAMFNHVLNKDGFIIREVWLRIAKQLHWNVSDTSNAWIKRTAKKVGSGRYCLYCGRVTQAKIPLSWMAEYNVKRRICLDCFTGRKGVHLITKSAIRFRFPQLPSNKLSFLEWRYDSNRDQEYLLSQVERLSTGEYEPPTDFKTAFELHYKSNGGKRPATNKKNNKTEPKKKSSKLLKDLGGGSAKPTPVSTKISPFSTLNKQNSKTETISNTTADMNMSSKTNGTKKENEIKAPIVIEEDDDFQTPKIKKIPVFKPVENTAKPKTQADPKKQRKPKAKPVPATNNSNLMSTLVSITKNSEEKIDQPPPQEKSTNNNDVVMADLIEATKETNITTLDSHQYLSSSIESNLSEASMGSQTSTNPSQKTKPNISKKRSVKPKTTTTTTNSDLSLSSSLKTPFKRPRRTEDQSPTDENGLAIPSPKKRLKKANNQSPSKLLGNLTYNNTMPHNNTTQNEVKTEQPVQEKIDLIVNQL